MAYSHTVLDYFNTKIENYQNYLSMTNQKNVAAEYIRLRLENENFNKHASFLCVGGGFGEPEFKILNALKEFNIVIDYVDASENMKSGFLQAAKKYDLSDKLRNICVSKFESNQYCPTKVDYVLCINAIQFISNWKRAKESRNSIMKMYTALNPGGRMLIVIKSAHSPHERIKYLSGGGKTTGETVRQVLQRLKLVYYWENVSSYIDITDCFVKNDFAPNTKGQGLISFFFRGEWETFNDELKQKLVEEIKRQSIYQSGKYYLPTLYEYIWVTKPMDIKTEKNFMGQRNKKLSQLLQENIQTIPNFPKQGVLFRDTTRILQSPFLMNEIARYFKKTYAGCNIKYIVAKDMQGLIWAGVLSREINAGIIPVFRKDLTGEILTSCYSHEYNSERVINIKKCSVSPGDRVLIVDYIIATGATIKNITAMLQHLGADVVGAFVLIELGYLKDQSGLGDLDIKSIVEYK